MADSAIGLLHPGEMGAALAMQLRPGRPILWASSGRSVATAAACRAGGPARRRDGRGARRVERSHSQRLPAPRSARCGELGGRVRVHRRLRRRECRFPADGARDRRARSRRRGGQYVDGGIVGAPPREGVPTRLYLSGSTAPAVADLFRETVVQARVVSDEPGSASAVKMAYAAWSKGAAALLLAIRALARAEGIEATLLRGVAGVRLRSCPNDPTGQRSRPAGRAGDSPVRWTRSPARSPRRDCPTASTRPLQRSTAASRS